MVSDQIPVMSVVVEYRLPVSVFRAVTVTPGSGMLPVFTTPCRRSPVNVSAGAAGLAGVDGRAAGADVSGAILTAALCEPDAHPWLAMSKETTVAAARALRMVFRRRTPSSPERHLFCLV